MWVPVKDFYFTESFVPELFGDDGAGLLDYFGINLLQEEKKDSITWVMPSSLAAAAAASCLKRKLGSCNDNSNNGKDFSCTTGSDSNSFGISMKCTEWYQTNNNIEPSAGPILAVSSCRIVTCNYYDCVVITLFRTSNFVQCSFERIHIPLTV